MNSHRPLLRLLVRGALVACVALPFPALPLLAADGDLDATFQSGAFTIGWTAGDARAKVLAPIANGELLVGGTVGASPGAQDGWAVAKLKANGTRELLWSLVFQVIHAADETTADDGDLLDMQRVAGDLTYLAGYAHTAPFTDLPMLARLTANGALDDTFDGNGIRILDDMPATWENLETSAAAVLPDGRSVFTGSCYSCPLPEEYWVWITVRLADGGPDPSFSSDGWHSLRFVAGSDSYPTAVAVDAEGKIVIGGGTDDLISNNDTFLVRLVASSAFDGSFGGGDGIAGPFATKYPNAIAFEPASRRIATASGFGGAPGAGHVRVYTNAGVPDTTFSGDGDVDLDLEEGTSLHDVAFQSDGKLITVGAIDANGANTGGLFFARMTTSGALDSTFDDNGIKRVEFDAAPDVRDRAYAMATMGGRLTAVGFAGAGGGQDEEMAVVRLENGGIFSDGFERGSTEAWAGF